MNVGDSPLGLDICVPFSAAHKHVIRNKQALMAFSGCLKEKHIS